jgi:hypothetical protein
MLTTFPIAIAFLLNGTVALAQPATVDERFVDTARSNLLEISRNADGSLSGPGWERLMDEAESAQFFMIGEQHATADIAQIAAAIHRGLATRGYDYMAAEFGPWSARFAEQLFRENDDVVSAIRSAPGNGYAIPFVSFAEDAQLHAQAVRLSPHMSEALWGVDQEFIAAAPILLPLLEALVRTEEQRTALTSFQNLVAGDPMAVGADTPDIFAALRAAFNTGEDQDALTLVDAIILSNRIYAPFTGRGGSGYDANLLRENYMKQNFLDHFMQAERRDGTPPRVFLKFGANHVMRGRSLTNVPALGDFIVEWGRTRNFEAVNIMIDCLGGEAVNVLSGTNEPCESYIVEEGSIITELAEGRPLTLIDLRPLRAVVRSNTAIDDSMRTLIFSFDYYLGVADVSPATLIPEPMQPPE